MDMSYSRHQSEPGLHWGGFVDEFNSFDVLPFDIYKSVRRDLAGNLVDLKNEVKTKLPLAEDADVQIKGMQAVLWAETIRNFGMIEYNFFPKIFGLVERAWDNRPDWSLPTADEQEYENAKQLYNAKISEKELPRLAKIKVNFRVAQPGIKITDGLLYANTSIPNAAIYYTTDGTEPTEQSAKWTEPIACNAKLIKAKTFYLGKQSVTTRLDN
jgi:hexosaminidase